MEEQHKNILRVYNCLSVVLAIIILSNIWCFYSLKKSYETNMAKIMEKTTTIEKEIVAGINHSTISETRSINDIKDLREYITTQYPRVVEKDINVIASETKKHCLKHDVPFPLVVGIIDVESSYNKLAKSNKDSHGLMQIRYKVWGPELGIKQRRDLHRIKVNIGLGVNILKYYIEKNDGNITKALQDYNGTCNRKFPDKVYKAVKKFTDFRSTCVIAVSEPNTEKVKINGKDKRREQSGANIGKRKRLPTSPPIQRKYKIVRG